jgi:hypothetical protein
MPILSPLQGIIDFLVEQFDLLKAALNPLLVIISMAEYIASFLPLPDERMVGIVADALAAVDSIVRFIGLADYVINLPVLLVVVGIILTIETGLQLFRAWRMLRSFIT